MPAQKRHATNYPGVYYIEGKAIGSNKMEKIFYIMYRKDGKQIQEKAGRQFVDDMTPSRAAAMRARRIEGKELSNDGKRIQAEAKKQAEAGKWTIHRLWLSYQENNPNLKGMSTYKSCYSLHIEKDFGEKEPQNIFPLDIARVKNNLLKKRSPQTVQHVLELLRRIIGYGVKNQVCKPLGFKIEMPVVDNEKTEDLSPEQLRRLLEEIDKDDHPVAGPMMLLALYTGMRRGEMFRLQWQDIDFERGFINIRNPKGGIDQKIPLNDAARGLLENHPRNESPFVFPGKAGGQIQTVRKPSNRIKERAGIPKDFRALHGLRHVFASSLASSGQVDMYVLQKLMTHKDSKMTERYSHLRDDTLKKASNLAGDIISRAAKDSLKPLDLINKRKGE